MKHVIHLSAIAGPPSDPERYQRQIRAQLARHAPSSAAAGPLVARCPSPVAEPDPGATLDHQSRLPFLLVDPDRPLLVRIVRVGGRPLDDDNLAGGCKELRDSVAAALGRRGDSQAEGLFWQYAQEPGELGTRIEITEMTP